jgi:hypothetical protein
MPERKRLPAQFNMTADYTEIFLMIMVFQLPSAKTRLQDLQDSHATVTKLA